MTEFLFVAIVALPSFGVAWWLERVRRRSIDKRFDALGQAARLRNDDFAHPWTAGSSCPFCLFDGGSTIKNTYCLPDKRAYGCKRELPEAHVHRECCVCGVEWVAYPPDVVGS